MTHDEVEPGAPGPEPVGPPREGESADEYERRIELAVAALEDHAWRQLLRSAAEEPGPSDPTVEP